MAQRPNDSSGGASDGDWSQWRRLVLAALEDTKDELEATRNKLQALETKLSVLEAKLVIWGAIGGVISAALVTAIIERLQHTGVVH